MGSLRNDLEMVLRLMMAACKAGPIFKIEEG